MKRLALASVLVSIGAYTACAVEEPDTGGGTAAAGNTPASGASGAGPQGGNAGSSAGGTTSGTTGQGGTAMTGGNAGNGVTGGNGGSGVTGGAGGMGGSGNESGAGMQGGTTGGGMAGATGGGMAGATGGGMAGATGGGMAGAMGGGMAGAMSGGMSGTGGGSACATIDQVFNTDKRFDGRLTETPCARSNSNDCTGGGWRVNGGSLTGCDPQNRLDANQTIQVGGVMNQNYTVTLRFYGIVEPKNYGGNVTRQNTARPTNNNDMTCTGNGNDRVCGASPPPFAYRTGTGATACQQPSCYDGSDYNSYEIHVRNPAGQEVCSYFLNADTQQGHWTYSLNYARTINVIGGGSIRIRSFDQNCRMIKNCTTNTSATDCTPYARTVNVSAAMPQPTTLQQPALGVDTANGGQWFLIDVVAMSCATAAPMNCAPLPNPM